MRQASGENTNTISRIGLPQGVSWKAVATILLVALADYLILDVAAGLNLFLFSLAVTCVLVAKAIAQGLPKSSVMVTMAAAVAALPLVEATSLEGFFLVCLALAVAAIAAGQFLPPSASALPQVLFRFLLVAPFRLVQDCVTALGQLALKQFSQRITRALTVWVVPVLCTLVFVALFATANPVIEAVLSAIDLRILPESLEPARLVFWLLVAAGVWALLRPRLANLGQSVRSTTSASRAESLIFGEAAILRSLIVFNTLFVVQTLLDLAYLWGGLALPDGMSYADYAHRGAYPLMVTAILAAVFVLVAMRPGGSGERRPLIRYLVYAWIAQNVMLCISSILRLDLYVEVYSLTGLRIAAGIWMGLVAAGLLLIMLRIVLRQSNLWLVATNLGVLAMTLYGCAYIDFSALIARFNVDHSRELSGDGVSLDLRYLAELGPTAIPALDHFIAEAADTEDFKPVEARRVRAGLVADFEEVEGWRSWTWRAQRLADYLRLHPIANSAGN